MKSKILLLFIGIFLITGCSNIATQEEKLETYKMYGPSMEPTYSEGDLLHVKLAEEINTFDVVVFFNSEDKRLAKRVIGLPGETVKFIEGKVYIGNEEDGLTELEEEYLSEENIDKTYPSMNKVTSFTAPQNGYFLLGDNRAHSSDSRSCFVDAFMGGCKGEHSFYITKEEIVGIVVDK